MKTPSKTRERHLKNPLCNVALQGYIVHHQDRLPLGDQQLLGNLVNGAGKALTSGRQIDIEDGTLARGAVNIDGAVVFLDQAESGAFI